MKKYISILYALLMTFTIINLSALTSYASVVTLSTNTRAELQDEIDNAGSTATTVYITDNFVFDEIAITIPADANITIRSDMSVRGVPLILTQTDGRHFIVEGALTLEEITLDGSTDGTSDTSAGGGITLNAPGSLTMNDKAVIQNCFNNESGGGVSIGISCTFTMNGGTISENTAEEYGGGVFIIGNRDGGATADNGKLIMLGGTISGNKSGFSGGGVEVAGLLEMSGGVISGNTANANGIQSNGGGGIFLDGARADLSGDAEISGNTAQNGGGISVNPGYPTGVRSILTISDNTKITGNTATADGGGGILIFNDVIMKGGTISNNIYSGSVLGGGGVLVAKTGDGLKGTFEMTGGSISGNTSTTDGGGIYATTSGNVNITGADSICYITDNIADGDGGGIFTRDATYANIITGINTHFSGNEASAPYYPPENALSSYPNIRF